MVLTISDLKPGSHNMPWPAPDCTRHAMRRPAAASAPGDATSRNCGCGGDNLSIHAFQQFGPSAWAIEALSSATVSEVRFVQSDRPAAARPTILQIIPRLDTGGAEMATVEITEAVVAAGGRALVISAGGRLAERITAAGGELTLLEVGAKNPVPMALNAMRLARFIEREHVDLVHARSRVPAWSALAAARLTRRPFSL